MTRNSIKRFRYAAGYINLFGLMLSIGTWASDVWFRIPLRSDTYLAFIWALGVFCWILGLVLFITAWVAERNASNG